MKDDERKQLFEELLDEHRHLENRAFATLGNFLMANAFLFVAWATFYGVEKGVGFRAIDIVLVALAIAGYIGGLAWALLGARNWEYCRRIWGELIRVGGPYRKDYENVYQVIRGLEESVHTAWNNKLKLGPLSYHATIISGTPLIVALLYAVMLVVLLWIRQASLFGCDPLVLPVIAAVFGLLIAAVACKRCCESSRNADRAVDDAKTIAEQEQKQASVA
jgi:hypothetical protein